MRTSVEAQPAMIGEIIKATMEKDNDVKLSSLLRLIRGIEILHLRSLPDKPIRSITADSRQVGPGSLFVAVRGQTADGHDYLNAAVKKGCAAVLVSKGRCLGWRYPGVICLEASDTAKALGQAAAEFNGHPARKMLMVGITGTNGKTTTTYLLESIIRRAGGRPGVIGTVNYRYGEVEMPAPFTTPDPVRLQAILAEMAQAGVTHVVMEVSSHALAQKRVAGILFDVALFTNLSRDHLDFHGDMPAYFSSKKLLFTEYLKKTGKAVVLCDDGEVGEGIDWGQRLAVELVSDKTAGYGKKNGRSLLLCGFTGGELVVQKAHETLERTTALLSSPQGDLNLSSDLVGDFNLKNMVGAVGLAMSLGITKEDISDGLALTPSIPGRLERVAAKAGLSVFVDFAHSPDALVKVLATMRRLASGRIIVIFGCGGDRDRGKRPLMGQVAGSLADVVVLTSDNPRSEDPQAILAEIEAGLTASSLPRMRLSALLKREGGRGYDIITSRREAIRETLRHARPGEVVLLCGKGHETYQITREGKFFFDDRLEAAVQAEVIQW